MKKIILIHGWDSNMYTNICVSHNLCNPWHHRKKLLELLSSEYEVLEYHLPGFCGNKEPNAVFWSVIDFAQAFEDWLQQQKIKPDLVLGYSFGGAIAALWKNTFQNETKIILVASALARKETSRSKVGKVFSFLSRVPFLGKILKHFYLMKVNTYYKKGTPFLRKTYDVIVRQNLVNEIKKLPVGKTLFVYGSKDTATPWDFISHEVINRGHSYRVISGDHSIGQTNPEEIFESIVAFGKEGTNES